MKGFPWLAVMAWASAFLAMAAVAAACGGSTTGVKAGDAGATDAATLVEASAPEAGATCKACKASSDCGAGSICAELGSATYCAPSCDTTSQCKGDTTCAPVNTATGSMAGACVARSGACGLPVGSPDAGVPDAPGSCGTLAGPNTPASCVCPPGRTCSPNGCRYGDYCDTTTSTCTPAPVGCGTPGGAYDGGAPPTGSVGGDGGAVSRLYFAVVGDTRPPSEDDTAGYPTAIITKIFADLEALSPRPTFAISTGDYQYANPTGTEGPTQLDLYLGARAKYSGLSFPAMGNHECTGFTASNCGAGNPDGLTNNYNAYLQKMLAPIGQTSPHYELDVNAADGTWTAKFLFVAANAWDQSQANWLDAALTRTTTYTFLVRHESASASTAPGVNPAENIMTKHPYTLSIVGHTHTYQHSGPKEVIVGNGGAPLSGGVDYGYGMLSQQSDGNIAVDMIDYNSGLADSSFHFAVKPDGSPAP